MPADSPTSSPRRMPILHRPESGWGEVTTKPVTGALGRLRRLYDYSMFVLLVGAVIALAILLETDDKVVALKIFVVAYFSLLPAILYLQFTSRKTPTVWREYVLTLFRLHTDDYGHLPEPPLSSRYHQPWQEAASAASERQRARATRIAKSRTCTGAGSRSSMGRSRPGGTASVPFASSGRTSSRS